MSVIMSGALSLLRFAATVGAMTVGVSGNHEAAMYFLMAAWALTIVDHTAWGRWGAAATEQGPGRIREERPWMAASVMITFTLAHGSGTIPVAAMSRTHDSTITYLYLLMLCALMACGIWWVGHRDVEPEVAAVPKTFGLLIVAIVAVGSFEWTVYQSHGTRFALLVLVAIAVLAIIHHYKLVTIFVGDPRYKGLLNRVTD